MWTLIIIGVYLFLLSYYFEVKNQRKIVIEVILLLFVSDLSVIHESFKIHRYWLPTFFVTYFLLIIYMFAMNYFYNWKIDKEKRLDSNDIVTEGNSKFVTQILIATAVFSFIYSFYNELGLRTILAINILTKISIDIFECLKLPVN